MATDLSKSACGVLQKVPGLTYSKFSELSKQSVNERKPVGEFYKGFNYNIMPSVDELIAHTLQMQGKKRTSLQEICGAFLQKEENSVENDDIERPTGATHYEETRESSTLSKMLSKLTTTLKYLCGCKIYDMATESLLDNLLTQACILLNDIILSQSSRAALNIPLQLLITICDVYNDSIWNKNTTVLNLATTALAKKTFVGVVFEVAQEIRNEALPNRTSPLDYASSTVYLVKTLLNAEETGSSVEIQKEFINGEGYWEVADAEKKFPENGGIKACLIYCIKVEDACRFWAYITNDWLKQLEDLHDVLLECLDDEDDDYKEIQNLTEPPHLKDLLLIKAENTPFASIGMPYIRVRVISLVGAKAKLWCVDLAECIVRPWNSLRRCPPDILKYPVLAKLCKISGLVAKPPVQILRNTMLLLVMFFSHWTFEVNEVLARNVLEIFTKLCECPDVIIRRLAMLCIMSFATLESTLEIKSSQHFHYFMHLFFRIVDSCATSPSNFSGDAIKEIYLLTSFIRTLMSNCSQLRLYFAEEKGLQVIMQLIQKEELESRLKMELWKLLKVVFGPGPYLEEAKTSSFQNSQMCSPATVPQVPSKYDRLPRRSIKHFLQERHVTSQKVDPFSEEDYPVDDRDYQCAKPKEKASEHRFLIRGHLFRVQQSNTAIMIDRRSMQHIIDAKLMINVCALLNSGMGGSIYIGIDENNMVEGLSMPRKQRDEIRLSFVKMIDKQLVPRIPPDFYELFYLKVFEKDEPKRNEATQHMQYVIQIKIKSVSSTLFQLVNGHCYFLENGRAKQVIAQEMRCKVIEAAEQQMVKSSAKK